MFDLLKIKSTFLSILKSCFMTFYFTEKKSVEGLDPEDCQLWIIKSNK